MKQQILSGDLKVGAQFSDHSGNFITITSLSERGVYGEIRNTNLSAIGGERMSPFFDTVDNIVNYLKSNKYDIIEAAKTQTP